MYDFEDKGGRRVAVRPEITAGLMRAFAEHQPAVPWKAWTAGPNFRYEAPQAARYRQHFQVDAEIVGTDDPDADVEVIALLDGFHRALGLTQRRLVVNSLGDDAGRAAYLAALTAYLQTNAADLTEQSRETLALNPLRVLDSRRPEDQPVVAAAPQVLEYLTPDAEARLRSGAGGAEGPRDRLRDRAPAGARSRLLQPHAVRVPVPRARLGAERHRRRRSLQRPGGGPRRPARDGRRRLRRGDRADPVGLRCRGRLRGPDGAGPGLRRRHDGWAGGAGPRRRAAGGRRRRRPVVRPAEHEEPDEGRRPFWCGGGGDRRTGRARRGRRDAARPLRADEQQAERRQAAVPRTGLVDAVRAWLPS